MSDVTLAAPHQESPWVPEPSTFAARLVLLRHHLDLSQKQAAEKCGLDDGSWSNWESGRRPRRMDEVVSAIASATGCSKTWLMWGSASGYKRDFPDWIADVSYSSTRPEQVELPFGVDRQLSSVC